jgi:hypothetical protein
VGRERRRRAEGEVGRGADGADGAEVAGWEAPWMVHEEVAAWVWRCRVLGEVSTRRRKEELRIASRRFEKFSGFLQMAAPVGDGAKSRTERACAAAAREDEFELVLFCV